MKTCRSCKKKYKDYSWEMLDLCPDCNDKLIDGVKEEELEENLFFHMAKYGKEATFKKVKNIIGKTL